MLVQKMGVLVDSLSPGREHACFSLRDTVEFKLQVRHVPKTTDAERRISMLEKKVDELVWDNHDGHWFPTDRQVISTHLGVEQIRYIVDPAIDNLSGTYSDYANGMQIHNDIMDGVICTDL